MTNGWDESAGAWIRMMGETGDWGRRYVLDKPMLSRVRNRRYARAVDIGCGEGRFCRMLAAEGVPVIGIDPSARLIEEARGRDPRGDYRVEAAENLSLETGSVDLAVCYLSLIDVDGLAETIAEIARVLQPGGTCLIANLQSFNTASVAQGWSIAPDGTRRFCIDHYFQERAVWIEWGGVRVRNHHRPFSTYMQLLLGAGFDLCHFDEPRPQGVTSDKADRYNRVPNFLIMEWQKRA